MQRKKVVIMGAAGRDFHNFNTFFRNNPLYDVIAFTATQIPDIAGRKYPAALAGKLYKKGIPIVPEDQLAQLIEKKGAELVVFAYSDVSHEYVMHKASLALAAGASFMLLGPKDTMLKSRKPVISICAVRTGAGKSPTSRFVSIHFRGKGYRVAIIRHPMPYGNLAAQAAQRFATFDDLDKQNCTIEEREEYEPHLKNGMIVYAGVDYEKILAAAEKEADIIIFDGGNNDFSFYRPDLHIVIADPHRAGHEISYHPGETNFRSADVIIISKVDSAKPENIKLIENHAKEFNPCAAIVKAGIKIIVKNAASLHGKRAIVIEDGPTLTHGGMAFGAGTLAAKRYGAVIVDAKQHAVGSIINVYKKYPHLKNVLPAMGYSAKQIHELGLTINNSKCDLVIDATPVNLGKIMNIKKPIIEVEYEFDEKGHALTRILNNFERRFLG